MHNKSGKYIFHLFIFLFSGALNIYAQSYTPGNCLGYRVEDNLVIFNCQNNVDVQIEQINSGILKIWYDTDSFIRNNESFAVILKGNKEQAINITEQPGSYEIYTSDLIVRINKAPFQIRIFDKWQKLLMEDYKNKGFEADTLKMSSYKTLKPGERIYGLGEKNGNINRIGSSFKMWNSDKPCYQQQEDPLYKSIPFFMSSEGYGIFFDNTYKTEYDFGTESESYYSFSAPGGEMLYYFIFGPTYKQIISRYKDLTGKPIMPPAWGLGFAQCRGMLTNEELTREIAKGYRDRQIPCDIIYQDIGWTNNLQDFEWRDGNYENPQKMLSDLESEGFKVIVSQDPVISQANKSQWNEADSLGYFAIDSRTHKTYDMPWPWGGNCGVVDFTKPEVADWWGNYQQKVLDDGVRGFWTDMGEPAWSNEESTDRLFMQHHLGAHNEIHNVYGFTWDKVVTEQFEKHNPNTRIFQMTRAAFAGMQRYTFGWSGDSGNGNEVTQGWEQLEAQVPLMMSAGMGLIPFWSCDISGYCGDIEDYEELSELYIRWLQFGAFNPLSRIHHEGNNAVEPWLFGSEAEAICKKAIEMKYQLFPYIYTYAREAYDTGIPVDRALMLEYPKDIEVADLNSQFMFGKEMLVAPVVEEGAAFKKVYLPKGEWIDFNNKHQIYNGNSWIDYPVELETVPIFVRKGSFVPQAPVMQYIKEKSDYPLVVDLFPADINKKASFDVYEDDGVTNDYKSDVFGLRKMVCKTTRTNYELTYKESESGNYLLQNRVVFYNLYLDTMPANVFINGEKMKAGKLSDHRFESVNKTVWNWNKETNILVIAIPKGYDKYTISIEK
ncbi:glycoside hydrolase family 31 protein [Plebeiibacterium sediminum]|uniref:Glycoside hydrolase family 31 protein n=1 Tax=Plebeiibacterium sediminum TaxID=2992112 RepID=A0AAE3M947_9BACT|nr:glycoside hydrolase family 31 protein [Plebeiobacterium sediminum]MCW3789276.1 glycoside hydrolase family 31 protein [Plebeiobacterium sediminum]